MHITLRQLRVFEAVARHLSYTRASQELHLSQPAVSMQVRQLEEDVGMPLFEKLGKRTELTEAGREVYNYSRSINHALQELEEVMQSLKGVSRGQTATSPSPAPSTTLPRGCSRSSTSATRGSARGWT